MNTFAASCYGIVLSIMQLDFVCNDKVFNQVDKLLHFTLSLTIHQRQLRFLGHLLRKPDKKPPHTSRFIGRNAKIIVYDSFVSRS